LFFIALEMILGITLYKDIDGGVNAITASVFLLAFSLIARPASLTTLLYLRAEFSIKYYSGCSIECNFYLDRFKNIL
jgi:multiple antibiotic resistance protein